MDDFGAANVATVRHYLGQAQLLVGAVSGHERATRLLTNRLAPDMFDAGFNLAIAIQFAARALCPPAGREVPEIPDCVTSETLADFAKTVADRIDGITEEDLTHQVVHFAGEAELTQAPADYVARFALPNMIFHLTLAYAVFRQAGLPLGKADFDAMHKY